MGLAIGVIRFILEFAYTVPVCGGESHCVDAPVEDMDERQRSNKVLKESKDIPVKEAAAAEIMLIYLVQHSNRQDLRREEYMDLEYTNHATHPYNYTAYSREYGSPTMSAKQIFFLLPAPFTLYSIFMKQGEGRTIPRETSQLLPVENRCMHGLLSNQRRVYLCACSNS